MTTDGKLNNPSSIPRPEHPRPDFKREDWLNLNGTWNFSYDPDNDGRERNLSDGRGESFPETIQVPYPWQSQLSGQHNTDYTGVVWYQRKFMIPSSWSGKSIFLRFGAVDYRADVWVNGQPIGTHEGGYSAFEFDITSICNRQENVLVVRVDDPANLYEIPHGKQASIPPDPWQQFSFATTSGIWQTVWLEARPECYVSSVRFTPNISDEQVRVDVEIIGYTKQVQMLEFGIQSASGAVITEAFELKTTEGKQVNFSGSINIANPELWDIDTPNLYTTIVKLKWSENNSDEVFTYFGMRQIEQRDGQIWLNGHPIYLMTALDQGYWPDGLCTAPSDEALKADVAYAKRIGLNGLRKHLKVEDPRFNYWADQLGLLMWCDMPCPTLFNDLACERLYTELMAMVERDYNHPSIIIWCPYNETWGLEFTLQTNTDMQKWVTKLYDQLKLSDPTRIVVDNSGWSHVKTDLADFHYYTGNERDWRIKIQEYANKPEVTGVFGFKLMADGYELNNTPLLLSEFGFGWQHDGSWSLRWSMNELRRHASIVGFTYCELYDIEYEYAGYTLYDRTPKEFGYDLATINSADFIVLDYQGELSVFPDDEILIRLLYSAYAHPPLQNGNLRWKLIRVLPSHVPESVLMCGESAIEPTPYTVGEIDELKLRVPNARGPVQLIVWVEDDKGKTRAHNTLDFEIYNPTQSFFETTDNEESFTFALSAPPGNKAKSVWNSGDHQLGYWVDDRPGAIWFDESGKIELRIPVISRLGFPSSLQDMTLIMELGSRPDEITQSIVGKNRFSDVTVSLNNIEVETVRLLDLHVHAGGALTRIHNTGVGEHGEWVELRIADERLEKIIKEAKRTGYLSLGLEVKATAEHVGGLTVFGSRVGRYGIDPTIKLTIPK
ncbi:MAG: beta galactosidase jelly roll domain-containing protein [Aggregatilineales bacterium]